jgi:3-deoxy-7-phosphoheptulonate synthase
MLRGGAFKPRTSPFAFKGLGREALQILAEAREETGLPVVTELLDAQHAEAIGEHADVVQIGARNMQNYALLEVAGKMGKPVLLKRGLSSSLDELLQAADYILKEGNEAVVLCERGIRTFETATRFTLDLGAVPWLKLHTHLPVIVDPSHAAGDRRLVEPLSRAAAAVGADGIIPRRCRRRTSPTTRATSRRTRRCWASAWPSRAAVRRAARAARRSR